MSLIPYDDLFSFPDFFGNQKMFKGFSITVDLIESKDSFIVLADVPSGVQKSDISSEFDNGYFSLSVSVKCEPCDDPDCKYIMKERATTGKCSRRFFISDKIDRSKIKASYENCVLKIVFPKLPQVQNVSKTISID